MRLRPLDLRGIRRRTFKAPIDLVCKACGHIAPYEVGTVCLGSTALRRGSTIRELEGSVGFSG